jgi:hypothetical protein
MKKNYISRTANIHEVLLQNLNIKVFYLGVRGMGTMRTHATWLDMGILAAHQSACRADENVMHIRKLFIKHMRQYVDHGL